MNDRERFNATMHYRQRDRSPMFDFGFWRETLDLWHDQGLPAWVTRDSSHLYFGMETLERNVIDRKLWSPEDESDPILRRVAAGIYNGLWPLFEAKVLEDRGDYELVQQSDGVRAVRKKYMGTIPTHEGHLLVDRESWRRHYKLRLDPSHPHRYPKRWQEFTAVWCDPGRTFPLILPGGSLYGWLRNWMGMENISLVVYDDPALFEEMVTTVADCIISVLTRVLATGGQFDGCSIWEDMCYSSGPLLGPQHFKQFLVPHYRRITDLLHRHGVDVIWVDCDGKIDSLIPLWMDAGVTCMMPIEVGTWGADPVALRRQFGKDLIMMGGFDKHILARSKDEIEAEVNRLTPLVEEGGYIGFCDHRVPPDVPLENYLFYVRCVRQRWGRGINLKPMLADDPALIGSELVT